MFGWKLGISPASSARQLPSGTVKTGITLTYAISRVLSINSSRFNCRLRLAAVRLQCFFRAVLTLFGYVHVVSLLTQIFYYRATHDIGETECGICCRDVSVFSVCHGVILYRVAQKFGTICLYA